MKDQTNHQSNNNQLISNQTPDNSILEVIAFSPAIPAQSITHINTLTIIHNNTKSTNGSSSRKAHNLVIRHLKEILKFHRNNPAIAINITNHDFHSIPENKNLIPSPFALIIGKTNKQKVKTAK